MLQQHNTDRARAFTRVCGRAQCRSNAGNAVKPIAGARARARVRSAMCEFTCSCKVLQINRTRTPTPREYYCRHTTPATVPHTSSSRSQQTNTKKTNERKKSLEKMLIDPTTATRCRSERDDCPDYVLHMTFNSRHPRVIIYKTRDM